MWGRARYIFSRRAGGPRLPNRLSSLSSPLGSSVRAKRDGDVEKHGRCRPSVSCDACFTRLECGDYFYIYSSLLVLLISSFIFVMFQ